MPQRQIQRPEDEILIRLATYSNIKELVDYKEHATEMSSFQRQASPNDLVFSHRN